MSYEATVIDGRDIKLRYRADSIMTIEKNAGKKIGPAGLKFIAQKAGIEFSASDKIPIELVMGFMDFDFDTMLWIWSYGLNHDKSGAKQEEAKALYDAYIEEGEPDDGERFKAFKNLAIDAINMARGIDTKKLIAKNKVEQDNAIIEKEKTRLRIIQLNNQARKEKEEDKDGTGEKQPSSASELSDSPPESS